MTAASGYPTANAIVYTAARGVFRLLFHVFTRASSEGVENLPRIGPFILASNHLSFLDGPLVLARTPRVVHGLVGVEYRDHPVGPLCTALGCVYVHRGRLDRTAVRQCRRILEDGGVLAIAIEGTRSRTGSLMDGKNGVAWLASQANVPVVPVALSGTDGVASSLRRLRRCRIHTAFGEALHLPPAPLGPDRLQDCTAAIMDALASLLRPRAERAGSAAGPPALNGPGRAM